VANIADGARFIGEIKRYRGVLTGQGAKGIPPSIEMAVPPTNRTLNTEHRTFPPLVSKKLCIGGETGNEAENDGFTRRSADFEETICAKILSTNYGK
jgi:hypothetical protein